MVKPSEKFNNVVAEAKKASDAKAALDKLATPAAPKIPAVP